MINIREKSLLEFFEKHSITIKELPEGVVVLTGEELAVALHQIRKKLDDGTAVYHESDLIEMFKNLNFPKPRWGAVVKESYNK